MIQMLVVSGQEFLNEIVAAIKLVARLHRSHIQSRFGAESGRRLIRPKGLRADRHFQPRALFLLSGKHMGSGFHLSLRNEKLSQGKYSVRSLR